MSNEAKQRFLELSVNEVSVVDSPANESDFVVIKSLNTNEEVGEMANEQNVNKGATQAEQVPVEVETPETDAVSKALTQVTELVANIAKATGASPPAAPETETPAAPAGDAAEQTTEKSESTPAPADGDAQPVMNEDVLNEAVSKAVAGVFEGLQKARTFTPKREEALKAAIEQLNELAKELGMTKIPVGQSPPVSTPSGASFGASGTQQLTKALEGLQSVVQSMQNTTKSLGDRLEAVEKTRNPSVAAPSDSNDGNDDEVSTEKSLWKGVL